MPTTSIPGYRYGDSSLPTSPVTLEDLDRLRQSVLFDDQDRQALAAAGEILAGQIDEILDVWYGFVAAHPHLVKYFSNNQGEPIGDYLAAVRRRFGQWILDTCRREWDQDWLNYQEEVAKRHHRIGKNRTDGVAAVDHIPMRYLIAFIYPITATIRPFLENGNRSAEETEKMFHAWFKAVTIQVTLWTRPYANDGDF